MLILSRGLPYDNLVSRHSASSRLYTPKFDSVVKAIENKIKVEAILK